jgi:hypothetical protein
MLMMRVTFLLLVATVAIAAEDAPSDFFETKIRPIFADHCYECHSASAKKVKGGLKLDSPEAIARGGESGALFVSDDLDKSLLIKAVRYSDPDLQMPPSKGGDKKLARSQIALIEEWVKRGAPMPGSSNQYSVISESVRTARTNWAFSKPRDPDVPAISVSESTWTEIDRFLIAKMKSEAARTVTSTRPSDSSNERTRPSALVPPADKRTLIRRATYDLTGLPPTPEEVRDFLSDNSTNAFSKLVERLLASPRYGEKWARHWLDVVRYTDAFDSRGIGGEADVPEAWRYRDWVVNAFNSDMPYDQFITQQIAGDILATNSPGKLDTNALIATGVYVIGEWGGGDADKEKMLTDIVDDQMDLTGRGFLGLTLACARCHDHKFDPISARDYYGLAGIFFSSHILPGPGAKTAGSPTLRIPLATQAELAVRKAKEQRVAELEKEIAGSSGVTLLTRAERGQLNQPTLAALHPSAGDLPNVVANSGDNAISFLTITLPGRSVAIHPSPEKNAAALWMSPIDGEVEFSGRVSDADDKCGNGVEWTLALGTNGIARGKLDNGGKQEIPATTITVRRGELVTLAIAPRGKDHSCDTTQIELMVRERQGERVWRLPDNVVADLPARANTGAWHFVAFAGAPPTVLQSNLSDEQKAKLESARRELAAVRKDLERKIPVAHGLQEGGTPQSAYAGIHDAAILIRGKYDRRGDVVPRQFPAVLAGENKSSIADKTHSGRLELAQWIANKDNPLTARVMVNRIWQHHFGEGIVRTPNNFGKLGTPPTHPELLDFLAHRFVESGWSIKAMHRLMMNSAAYQAGSVEGRASNLERRNDPENLSFSRMNRRRLTAEELRDALLFVGGRLDFTMGGPSINDLNTKRRTLYVMTIRSDKSNYRSLFDAPDAQVIAEKRLDSTVAPQALFLLNSPFVLQQAEALAQRALKRDGDDAARVRWLYEMLYSRETSAREIDLGVRATGQTNDLVAAWTRYCQVLLCANEFIYVD